MMIKIEDLEVWYDSIPVLRDVSLEINRGDFILIIGPNGSGKTTLLKTIANLVKPKKGAVYIDGRELNRYSPRSLSKILSYIDPHLSREMPTTVLELLMTARYPREDLFKIKVDKEFINKINEVAKMLRIEHLLERRLDQVSSGELQRIIIARALLQDPEIFLVDEPTAFLDLKYRFEIMDLLKKINREYMKTMIVTTHDLILAGLYGEKIILLYKGMIRAAGDVEKVLKKDLVKEVYEIDVEEIYVNNRKILIPINMK